MKYKFILFSPWLLKNLKAQVCIRTEARHDGAAPNLWRGRCKTPQSESEGPDFAAMPPLAVLLRELQCVQQRASPHVGWQGS